MDNTPEVTIVDLDSILIVENTGTVISTMTLITDNGTESQPIIQTRLAGFCLGEPHLEMDFLLSPERARRYISQLIRTLREYDMEVERAKQNPPVPEN